MSNYNLVNFTKKHKPFGWLEFFNDKNTQLLIENIDNHLENEMEKIMPPVEYIWNAFIHTPFKNMGSVNTEYEGLKVVILGMDPYPRDGIANGLSFSSYDCVKTPASLQNIYKVLEKTIEGFKIPKHSNLQKWASQGVLMLNAYLTCKEGKPGSHKYWKPFTQSLINYICKNTDGVIFFIWGEKAKDISKIINAKQHKLFCMHPSPRNWNKYKPEEREDHFSNCDHFVRANEILKDQGKKIIDWTL
jgi:uracil-DNA glycosylase